MLFQRFLSPRIYISAEKCSYIPKKYYLKVNRRYTGNGTFNLYANMQQILMIHPLSQASTYIYSFSNNESNYFRFEPDTTRTYTFETSAMSGDPYLELYDQTMTRLTYNDDGGDENNALITYSLQAGKIYYIKVLITF